MKIKIIECWQEGIVALSLDGQEREVKVGEEIELVITPKFHQYTEGVGKMDFGDDDPDYDSKMMGALGK